MASHSKEQYRTVSEQYSTVHECRTEQNGVAGPLPLTDYLYWELDLKREF